MLEDSLRTRSSSPSCAGQNETLFGVNGGTPIIPVSRLKAADWDACNFIVNGDSTAALAAMPENIAHTAVTSPPYFGQRDYGVDGQVGSELSPGEYIDRLVRVFRELRRVLREDGTLWLNLGDKYSGGSLLGMPWRVALALVDDGWNLRSDVIWHKPNAMPSSVKSRPTTDHEYIFMFSKGKDYYYDSDSIREPHVTFSENSKMRGGRNHLGKRGSTPEQGKNGGNSNLHNGRWDQAFHPLGRNKRTVWSVPLGKFREAHFAVFPDKLIDPCVVAGSPPNGVVIDPFFGAGTAGLVALNRGRKFVGIDLNPDYCQIARNRLIT
ncbi:DNA-methyltransferase [Burkholderia cepacia]|uniref:DNA-methyltransferase n=1 Tax=Burkholderia cepacia TaxID=292 RepID=UPI001C934011|nr:site-specific DNA-methyltransferase [Burkholderia cepacia]MBY4710101.1 site-specific DNA-methyltransferase [Burkholderia cepacia]MBY4736669.1 site-specific DNA-methyltransferase [Burkholderia cepacia]MBY4747974.1 site-specific DNA-methyltransferase [Burkholderia cepacia]MBY4759819.1 site-specific DNA-methyltransferase [Burkholderia cepacia]MBY4774880.1 site-specific DNA-methyltransferase [Burkholderia cepacia]